MIIVFDTNVIVQNWYLKGPNFDIFQKYLELSRDKFIIPQIVVLETINQYREKLIAKYEKFSALNIQINRMLQPSVKLDLEQLDIGNLCCTYQRYFERRLKELGAIVLDHADIPHDIIVSRDLARRNPFKGSGKGYRDTLLWEVILDKVADNSEVTLLITSDLEDFGNNKKPILNDHLIDDLTSNGLHEGSVQILEKIEDFNTKYAKPKLQPLNDIKEKLECEEEFPFSITEWFEENRNVITESLTPDIASIITSDILNGYDIDEPITIEWIEAPTHFVFENVFELDLNRIIIELSFMTDVSTDFFVFKSDYYTMPDGLPIDIVEFDWNDHYALMNATMNIPISLSLTFNIEEKEIENYEVNFIEYYGRCMYCDEPIMSDAAETCPKCGKSLF